MGKISGKLLKYILPKPHDCEYEKTYYPFIILKKKKYVGYKYEEDTINYKIDNTGTVLKRRDNAPIVKEICTGIVNKIMNGVKVDDICEFLVTCLKNMFEGKYDIRYFLQTRELKSNEHYKDWSKIAHMVLANRIAKRENKEKIQSGIRLEYAVVKKEFSDKKNRLQGDFIETKDYIIENNLKLDYMFYLTNQIMNPTKQFLELVYDRTDELFDHFLEKYKFTKNELILMEIKKISANINMKKSVQSNDQLVSINIENLNNRSKYILNSCKLLIIKLKLFCKIKKINMTFDDLLADT